MHPVVEQALAHRRAGLLCAALACLLCTPALFTGFMTDDYWILARLKGVPDMVHRGPLDLFDWYHAEDLPGLKERGILPWSNRSDSNFALWRPMASATHWLDATLWPDRPVPMHVQNLLWLAALILIVSHLHRQIIGTAWIAGLASLLYAVDDARAIPAGWIAGRNGLLGPAFALGALALHVRWRRRGSRLSAMLAPVALLLGLLSNEGALAGGAYLLGYAVFLDEGRVRDRVRSLAPYALVVLAWRMAYDLGGYGVTGKGSYIDPLHSPWRFVGAVVSHGPVLFLGQWALPPSDLFGWVPFAGQLLLCAVAIALLICITLLLWPLLQTDRVSRFWYASMLLCLVPTCAALPSDRLLAFAGVGASALIATFLARVRAGAYQPGFVPERLQRAFYRGLVGLHLVLAPLLFVATTPAMYVFWNRYERALRSAPLGACSNKTLVQVNGPNLFKFLTPLRQLADQPLPRRMRHLGPPSGSALHLSRPDDRTLVVRPLTAFPGGRDRRWVLGQRVELSGITVEIREVGPDHRPLEVAYVFDAPLEDDSFVWLRWHNTALEPFTPPDVGQTLFIDKN